MDYKLIAGLVILCALIYFGIVFMRKKKTMSPPKQIEKFDESTNSEDEDMDDGEDDDDMDDGEDDDDMDDGEDDDE